MSTIKKELKQLSAEELAIKVDGLRRELFSLRLHAATSAVKNYKQPGILRREIARALTYLKQKQLVSK